jgi:hypothetical protein
MGLKTIFLVAAAICFLLGTFPVNIPRTNLVSLGLFFLTVGEFFVK